MDTHKQWMNLAILEARKAEKIGEVPIGAVLIRDGEVIASSYNQRETKKQALAHAELIVIKEACEKLDSWRLTGCTLYVTLEPCPMCAGAIIQSRIETVVFAASDRKAGCAGTLMNLLDEPRFNHQTNVISGCLEEECSSMISSFFQQLRKQKKISKKNGFAN